MCELLGMSASVPTDICFSFAGLMRRGGDTGPHEDGWGIAFYEGKGYRAFHDPGASADSEIARFVQSYSIKSNNVLCHIRKANRGKVSLENTHPFAHNGQLKGVKKLALNHYQPVGTTDSEHAFCWLLGELREHFSKPPKNQRVLWTFIQESVHTLSSLGIFNMLMSDGRSLFTHCSTKLNWLTRQAPFGNAQLIDADMTVDFADHTQANDVVTVIATQPLTSNEQWQAMARGQFSVFQQGQRVWPRQNKNNSARIREIEKR